MKWFVSLSAICALVLVISLTGRSFGTFAQTGTPDASPDASPVGSPIASPVASPVASVEATDAGDDLESVVFDLQATVSAQSDEIAALQTQVADLAAAPAEVEPTEEAVSVEVQDLTVVIVLRARADEVTGEELGDECAGSGRWSDFSEDTVITISDPDETLLATGSLDSSEIVFAGTLFRECRLTYTVPDVPLIDDYIFEIEGRSTMTRSQEELDDVEWVIALSFGP